MKNQPLSELSLEQLETKEKSMKQVVIIFIVIIVLMVASGIYLTIEKGFGVFTVLPVAFLPLFMGNFKELKNIRAEIASRK